ncbi:hypothetical protein NDU88_005072 [Pleurodeles waltl]|uniref:Uncharacterized protein n=1 Tax=Pleurodeles waltl TaxID=8319 RepID=A0AAV7PMM7_PLEWA|nr:hypothetical protein NDU88_005072 [Pleurodeles waltl]
MVLDILMARSTYRPPAPVAPVSRPSLCAFPSHPAATSAVSPHYSNATEGLRTGDYVTHLFVTTRAATLLLQGEHCLLGKAVVSRNPVAGPLRIRLEILTDSDDSDALSRRTCREVS